MKQDYPRLDAVSFSKLLLKTKDLDPLYVALYKSDMPRKQLCRWLVAYWCYYHAGVCCWIVEQPKFFKALLHVANSGTKYPRGTERRHFRGELAVRSIKAMATQFSSASDIVDWLIGAGPLACEVIKRVKTLNGFGEWISWKVPDMIERLGLAPLVFTEDDLELMFKSSKQGAQEVYTANALSGNVLRSAHQFLTSKIGNTLAPPLYDRTINVQETETIFCKWKSHLSGHYPVGKDTIEIREGLSLFTKSQTVQRMLGGLPCVSLQH